MDEDRVSAYDGIWIHLAGGNGSGKTTVLQSIREECPPGDTFWYVFADSGGALPGVRGSGKVHDKYKAPKEVQWKAILDDWNSEIPVIVSDGTRVHYAIRNAHEHGVRNRKMVVVVLYQTPDVMRAHLQRRCDKRGKTFREDFWTVKNLQDIGRDHWKKFYFRYPKRFTLHEFEVDLGYSCIPEVRQLVRRYMAEGKWLHHMCRTESLA